MSTEILARLQFAVTIMFHYLYPVMSIGVSAILVIVEGFYLWTKNKEYLDMAKFWTKVFALTFAVGVASGIVMEFEFGTNWSTYSRYVGDVFGSALAAEGVFAFFLESGFLAILLFGWNRVGPKMHFFSTLMVSLGAHFSAIWIVVANSWMQTPAGFRIVGEGLRARAEITDFWEMVFNPSAMTRLGHVILGAWMAGAFLVMSISAYYILRNKYQLFAKRSFKIALVVGTVAVLLQTVSGDSSARGVVNDQPAKLAAMEGLYKTTAGAPFTLMGWVEPKNERVVGIKVPYLLSILAYRDPWHKVTGLEAFPKDEWPPSPVVFQTYRLMLVGWSVMFLLSIIGVWKWWRGTLFTCRWLMWCFVFSIAAPQIANQAGWVTAEMGRQPWIVYNLLRTSEGLSKAVTSGQILGSLIMFTTIYFFLFIMFIYILTKKIKAGPEAEEEDVEAYHGMQHYVEELQHD